MSISPEERNANLELALKLFLEELKEHYYGLQYIHKPEYPQVYTTTWQELLDKHLLTVVAPNIYYRLTAHGWRRATELVGWDLQPTFLERLGRVSGALKDCVKGRDNEAIVSVSDIATTSGQTADFVQNVVESDLLRYKFDQVSVDWAKGADRVAIRIPINVGHKL